jgi:hypothetical protein
MARIAVGFSGELLQLSTPPLCARAGDPAAKAARTTRTDKPYFMLLAVFGNTGKSPRV